MSIVPVAALPADVSRGASARRATVPAVVGTLFVAFFVVLFLFGDHLARFRATELAGQPLVPPGGRHLLGTNLLGQDVASQLVLGARASLSVAVIAGVGTVVLGGLIGVTAGWFGGWVDATLMRLTDVVLVLPRLPLLLLVGALTGGKLSVLALVIAATFWPLTARILRSQVLTLRARTNVTAATGFGAGSWHQLRRHILPELSLLGIAELVPAMERAVTLQAGLAFLGVGDPTQPTWGGMMRDAIRYRGLFVTQAWKWWLVPPVLAIVSLVAGIAVIGTAAETRLRPRLSRHAS
jgi:ABC-type dipeptide/oligopeptide/nickel transport system permease subunit